MMPVEERLRQLAADDVPRPSSLDDLRRRVRRRRARRVGSGVLLTAVATVALVVAWPGTDGQRHVTVTDAPTTAPTPAPLEGAIVVASPEGVERIDGVDRTQITDEAAGVAFGIGDDTVVYQTDPEGFGPYASGPIRMWKAGAQSTLPTAADATNSTLLDARTLGGAPVALVAERTGGVGPDDTFEALVLIDLGDGRRTVLDEYPAWESGVQLARLLDDGDVLALVGAEASLFVSRWSGERQLWSVEAGIDTVLTLASSESTHAVIGFADGGGLYVQGLDAATGAFSPGRVVDTGTEDLRCRDWLDEQTLLCAALNADPVAVSVADGHERQVVASLGGVPTRVRP